MSIYDPILTSIRQFMTEEPSLQALVDISNHPTLSQRLTEVIISTFMYSQGGDIRSTTAQNLYLGGYATHSALIASGQARDMLAEAFSRVCFFRSSLIKTVLLTALQLPNLRKVGLRDYDARGRFRDGENVLWRSYGHSLTGNEPVIQQPPDQIWILLLNAIALSGANVPGIEVFLRHAWRLSEQSFEVLSGRMSQRVLPVLAQLRSLMLTIGSDHQPYRYQSGPLQSRYDV